MDCHSLANEQLIIQAKQFKNYFFDPAQVRMSDDTVSLGGFRPLWPIKCAGIIHVGQLVCRHCNFLSGKDRHKYCNEIGMRVVRSPLTSAHASCVMGRKKMDNTVSLECARLDAAPLDPPLVHQISELQSQVTMLQSDVSNQERLTMSHCVASIGQQEALKTQLQMTNSMLSHIQAKVEKEKQMLTEVIQANAVEITELHYKMDELAAGLTAVMAELSDSDFGIFFNSC